MQGHEPIDLTEFNGLWERENDEEVPQDHFTDCENLQSYGDKGFQTRYGLDWHQDVAVPLGNVVRIYNYITQDENTLLVLTWDGTDGKIYHVVDSTSVFGPILTIAGMEDFAFVPFAGRAYISPFKSYPAGDLFIEKGLENEFLYVYAGDGTSARKAAGTAPVGTLVVANGAAGNTDAGTHLFGVIFETDTGYLTPPAAFEDFATTANLSVSFSSVPTGGSTVTKRHIVATKKITDYNGNTTGYDYFFIPNATINDNVSTTLSNISFFDADLLEDASHLLDNYDEIPAGCALSIYHNRLCLSTTFDDISLVLVSAPGEPEAINQISGLLVVPLDGNPITNHAEMRDVLYVTKRNRTVSYVDNEDDPSTWEMTVIDQGFGAPVHGIATVIDSGSSTVDYLIMASLSGIILFNGRFISPELGWKIRGRWDELDKNDFRNLQLVNDSVNMILYCSLPDRKLMTGDYKKGLDPKSIRWWPWRFDIQVNTIALVNINELIIGSDGALT